MEQRNTTGDLARAGATLKAARDLLDRSVWALREKSLEGAAVSSKKLDEHQVLCHETALSFADVTAAEFALAHAARSADARIPAADLDVRLALAFTAEVLTRLRSQLLLRAGDYGIPLPDLLAALETDVVRAFCTEELSPARLEALGRDVLEACHTGSYALDEHHEMMRGTFRKFAATVVAPLAEEIHRHDLLVPDSIIGPLAELGGFGLSVPEQYGGLQAEGKDDTLGMIVVTEELSRASLCAAGSLITRPEILSRALLKGGTEAQKEKWLPKLASGELLCAVAVTEPDYGSDVAGMKLRATRTEGGWLLNGVKSWCTFGGKAHVLMVLARTNPDLAVGHRGLSLFLVEKRSFDGHDFEDTQPGGGKISGRAIATIGYRGMHSYETFFENTFVPDENLLGGAEGEGKGFYFTMAGFAGGRIQTAARAIGLMQAAFDRALSYAKERKVFGHPIGDYQLTRAKIARMAALLGVCRQFTYGVGRLMDEGRGEMEASLVKLYACRAAQQLCHDAVQIHGGMGYAEETAVSRYYVDARVLSIFEGAEETLALKVVARSLVDRAKPRA